LASSRFAFSILANCKIRLHQFGAA
jgi:hypothetical protein